MHQKPHLAGITNASRVLEGYRTRFGHLHSLVGLVHEFPVVGDVLMAAGVLLIVAGVVSMIISVYRQRIGTAAVQIVVGATIGALVMSPALLQSVCGTTVRLMASL